MRARVSSYWERRLSYCICVNNAVDMSGHAVRLSYCHTARYIVLYVYVYVCTSTPKQPINDPLNPS